MATAGEIEKAKLTGTFINTLAAACVIVGALTPIIGTFYGEERSLRESDPGNFSILVMFGWIAAGFALHMIARAFLSRIDQ